MNLIKKTGEILDNPSAMVKIHRILAVVWFILIIPTVVWLKESILWVGLMSAYALGVGHWSASQAAEGELQSLHAKVDDLHDKVDDLADKVD